MTLRRQRQAWGRRLKLSCLAMLVWCMLPDADAAPGPKRERRKEERSIEVLFSPDGGCADRIIEEIASARKIIRVQAYFFTSEPIADALVEARERGIRIEVILDKSQEKMTYGRWRVLRREGIRIYFDREHATANNKIILIDDRTVITGSYNYTRAAEEKNAENLLLIQGFDDLFEDYRDNFKKHRSHARRYSK